MTGLPAGRRGHLKYARAFALTLIGPDGRYADRLVDWWRDGCALGQKPARPFPMTVARDHDIRQRLRDMLHDVRI